MSAWCWEQSIVCQAVLLRMIAFSIFRPSGPPDNNDGGDWMESETTRTKQKPVWSVQPAFYEDHAMYREEDEDVRAPSNPEAEQPQNFLQ